MYFLNVLLCMSVFSVREISSAFARRRCFDCVSIESCESGINFARRLSQGSLPPQSRQIFFDAICGTDSNNPALPKVCCSAFAMRTDVRMGDPIESHSNIGLLPTSCGDIEGSRIVNGRTPKLYELPWMTLIAYNTSRGVEFLCGGSVINSRYILTAAHCVTKGNNIFKKIVSVRIGEFDYSTEADCQGDYDNMICETKIQNIEVEEIIPHESFTGLQPVEGDIALLRLKEAIEMTNNAAPICLPVYSDLRNARLAGRNATIAGWGMTENEAKSTKLLKADIPILDSDICSYYYNRYIHQRNSLIEKSFCAGDAVKDSCDGDSGGPLIVESDYNNHVRLVQFGIVSYGPKQCGSEFPGVYTDVTKYMDWILENIRP